MHCSGCRPGRETNLKIRPAGYGRRWLDWKRGFYDVQTDEGLDRVESQAGSENVISHGICGSCRDNVLFQMGVELGEFLDSLKLPVVVVNRGGTIITGNNQARTVLRKELPEIEGYKGGDVFECVFARLPDGCGNTMHCSGCTIRKTVMETHGTGRSFLRVPTTLNRNNPDDPKKIKLFKPLTKHQVSDAVR